ncbi:MAG: GIY-YIG nuclease family protein [Alistipes sp.]|nr:GIY-YIG nuclease family protein [Alistipes sp.]
MKHYYIYIMGNKSATTVYVGVTDDIKRRVHEHKHCINQCFTSRYKCFNLLYFEEYNDIRVAIAREKELKGWKRERKESLIASQNPHRIDLAGDWFV